MITDEFLFIHMPRTGGQFIIHRLIGTKQWNFYKVMVHVPLSEMKDILLKNNLKNDIPSFCFTRNPWDWYVSRFHLDFAPQMVDKNYDYKKEFIDHILVIDEYKKNENEKFYTNHKKYRKRVVSGEILSTSTSVEEMIKRQFIFSKLTMSDWFNFLVDGDITYFCNFDNFSEEISILLPKVSSKYNYESIKQITTKKLNNTKHKHYSYYYNKESIDIIHKLDKKYIEKFNYDFVMEK